MTISSTSIICLGLTPCIQRILEFDTLHKGRVNRAAQVTLGIGGKGANTARMVTQLGAPALLVGFAGGSNGRLLEQMLEAEGVAFSHIETQGDTRICQTLVEAGHPETTELVEEMPPISETEWSAMLERIDALDLDGAVVPISGKLPAGAPTDAYAQVTRRVQQRNGRVLLDAPGKPLLKALPHGPALVKINDEELLQTMGGQDVQEACRRLLAAEAGAVLITRGSRSAFYMDRDRALELIPPRIEAVNPVGSGDAVTAGMAIGWSAGWPVEQTLRYAMACGAANALHLKSGWLVPDEVERLAGEVQVRPL